jgi:acyl-coenzyme A thioesterase PaaI-like protein
MNEPLTAAQLQEKLTASPFIRFLGLTVIEADPVRQVVTMTLPMRAEFERIAGSGQWHGGPLAAVIDTVGDYALVMSVGRPLPALTATARVRRAGRSVGVVDVDVTDSAGNLVAIGRASYSTQSG